MSGKGKNEILSIILAFLHDIGLEARPAELAEDTFLPGLTIDYGRILYDEARLTYVGDLLHEAAHIAVVPPDQRPALQGGLADTGGVEMAAIAWTYAAALYLKLDPAMVFDAGPDGYQSGAAAIVSNFSQGHYFGVPILAWRGMAVDPQQAGPDDPPPYPAMQHWLCPRPDPLDEAQAASAAATAEDVGPRAEIVDVPSPTPVAPPQPPPAKPPELVLLPFTGSRDEARERFSAISKCLLGDDGGPGELRQAANDLYAFFNEIGGQPQDIVGGAAFTWQQETRLPSGKAINPFTAATCLLDYARTRAFARGVQAAIRAAQTRFPGERIEVLYAGTGPFAPLALLQTPFFGPHEVRFTLIDTHPAALKCQSQIVSVLGLESYIEAAIPGDAIQWTPPEGRAYHVVAAEVMQRGLVIEPQVAMTLAIARHLRPGGFLVPERVELSFCLLNLQAEINLVEDGIARQAEYFRLSGDSIPDAELPASHCGLETIRERLDLGRIFTLTASVAEDYDVSDAGRIGLPPLRMPDDPPAGRELRVLTRITTSGDIVLDDYASGLTFPELIFDAPSLTPGVLYEVWYETLGTPGLRLQPTGTA